VTRHLRDPAQWISPTKKEVAGIRPPSPWSFPNPTGAPGLLCCHSVSRLLHCLPLQPNQNSNLNLGGRRTTPSRHPRSSRRRDDLDTSDTPPFSVYCIGLRLLETSWCCTVESFAVPSFFFSIDACSPFRVVENSRPSPLEESALQPFHVERRLPAPGLRSEDIWSELVPGFAPIEASINLPPGSGLLPLDASCLDRPPASKMNQQPELFFPAYAMNAPNRSPGSARPGYNTTSGLPGANRMNHRQMDPVGQAPAALFAADDRFGSYDSNAFRHNRMQPTPGFAADGFGGNAQAWAYNSGASTVTGVGGDGRLRPGARRAIPTVRSPLFPLTPGRW
jgi:hypothetical protein